MHRVKDIYGKPHLFLPMLLMREYFYPRKTIPVTIEALELEIRITKGILIHIREGREI